MVNRIAQRITHAFLVFGAALTLMLGLSFVAALKSTETNMLDDILHAELDQFRLQVETARSLGLFHSRTTIIYVTPLDKISDMPVLLRDLPEGIHDVMYEDRNYRVLVKHYDGIRYTVQFDDTNIHKRKQDFIHLVWLCSILMLIIAYVIGWWEARKVTQPITQLANHITASRNKPEIPLNLSEFNNDDEISLLAHEIQSTHEKLQKLLIREKEFAGNVSHELRTPVTIISLTAEVLAAKPNLSTIEQERIQRIQRAVGEISELIETFLILAQIYNESDTAHYSYEMGPIVYKVIEQQRVWLGDKPIEVRVVETAHFKVSAPAGILSVLVANLVRNAFRYTEQGMITVSLTSNQLTVADTGVGIDACMQEKIFNRNVNDKSDDSNRVKLGMAIVQRICECYGWSVSFESEKGKGSQFTVLFASLKHAQATR
ncbi:MAG: HAMP domain-containing histidine kinase [Burkholderiales bacterium]|nr:HAMP domain-containing histidine kinase [Burkholderiales bacterium]MDR4517606.1 HAMP domain-containing histidine kinase [Nitrosomonas sp.]